ncbi:hypothetical protein AKJ09_01980 [Labilithrix luteola]|uniref:BNR repeat domain protein n=1 Tax=Labilithrix luteola TaxID=1391654 RepID=A0A0K1PPL1_9BACT|nr:hypothetical protein [Labilithrix luteola]AKU95316.1 hypothetical protein AKJ09_01980 [Labilithrix luteola]
MITTTRAKQCSVLGMRTMLGGWVALGVVTLLFACESSEPRARDMTDTDAATDSGPSGPAPTGGDAGVDANVPDSGEDDDFVVPDASVVCGTGPCAVTMTGHGDSFCVVLQSGKMSCWGSNASGQLGYEADGKPFSATPHVLDNLANVTSASVGESNACARVASGDVFCWGAPDLVNAGILPADGSGTFSAPVSQPTRMSAVPAGTSIAVGKDFACATASDGSLSCWGTNANQELGRGVTDAGSIVPPAKALLVTQEVAAIVPGASRTFAITSNNDLLSWGAGSLYGRDDFNRLTNLVDYLLGRAISEDVDGFPALVPGLARVRGVATSSRHGCAVVGRDVQCWGSNELGQLGRGSFNPAPTVFQLPPSFLPDISNLRFVADAEETDAGVPTKDVPIQVAVADEHSCAAMGSGHVYCWGKKGDKGVLGSRPTQDLNGTPTRIDGLSEPAVGVASAGSTVCALLRSGAVECWGSNAQGQLGTGKADDLPHPAPSRVVLPN